MAYFLPEEIKAMKNSLLVDSDLEQIEDAHYIAIMFSEDSDDKENSYLSILSHYGQKENKKELELLISKIANFED